MYHLHPMNMTENSAFSCATAIFALHISEPFMFATMHLISIPSTKTKTPEGHMDFFAFFGCLWEPILGPFELYNWTKVAQITPYFIQLSSCTGAFGASSGRWQLQTQNASTITQKHPVEINIQLSRLWSGNCNILLQSIHRFSLSYTPPWILDTLNCKPQDFTLRGPSI